MDPHSHNFIAFCICLFYSAAQNFTGQSIFSAVGHRYSHFFSLDICQDGMRAHCGHKHKAVSVSDDKREIKGIQRDVWSHVCRATLLDHSIGDMFYIEPVRYECWPSYAVLFVTSIALELTVIMN